MTEYRNYRDIVETLGTILLERTDDDYSGDSRFLLKRTWFKKRPPGTSLEYGVRYGSNAEYGYLCFGWGSCSACDAFKAADEMPPEAAKISLEELRVKMQDSIVWKTAEEMRDFILNHDWKGDYSEDPKFIEMASIVMRGLK